MKKFFLIGGLLVFLAWATKVEAAPLTYTIDYRNPNITIPDEKKQAVINQALRSWPKSKIESQWDYVYNQAVSHGWNPAFVIALWIEESGASGVDAWDLGCLGGNKNNIASQLTCLFERPYANQPFRPFMCKYSGESKDCYTNPNYNFSANPHFPPNLGFWYCKLTGNANVCNNLNVSIDPSQPPIYYPEEVIILLKDSFSSNNFSLDYRHHEEEHFYTSLPPTPSLQEKVQGIQIEKGTGGFDGELNITKEGKNLPDFKIMERTLSFSLERLLPENLRRELFIDDSQEIRGKTLHFVYGLGENGEKLLMVTPPPETPEERANFSSWWNRLIGESKVVCGLFNTCPAPESLNIKVAAADEYNPPEGLGHRDSSSLIDKENLNNKIIHSRFTIISFFKKIIEEITTAIRNLIDTLRKETTTTAAVVETRAIVPGGENVRENTSFFKNFIPASAIPAYRNSPLKVSADYEVSSDYTIRGEEKLEYHNLGASQRNYCLSICSQYPSGFDISQIDPLCSSCNPSDYPLEGYGDIPLNQGICQQDGGGECLYEEPPATEECYNPDVCYERIFAPNPAGGFGECQYASPTVCVHTNRLKTGQCATICNRACCANQ